MSRAYDDSPHIPGRRPSDDSDEFALFTTNGIRRAHSSARSPNALHALNDPHKALRRTSSMFLTNANAQTALSKPSKPGSRKPAFQVLADVSPDDPRRRQKAPSSLLHSAFGDLTNKTHKQESTIPTQRAKRQSFSGWAKSLTHRGKKQSNALDQSYEEISAPPTPEQLSALKQASGLSASSDVNCHPTAKNLPHHAPKDLANASLPDASFPLLPPLHSNEDLQNMIEAALVQSPDPLPFVSPSFATSVLGSDVDHAIPVFTYGDAETDPLDDLERSSLESDTASSLGSERPRSSLDVPRSEASSFRNYMALGRPGVGEKMLQERSDAPLAPLYGDATSDYSVDLDTRCTSVASSDYSIPLPPSPCPVDPRHTFRTSLRRYSKDFRSLDAYAEAPDYFSHHPMPLARLRPRPTQRPAMMLTSTPARTPIDSSNGDKPPLRQLSSMSVSKRSRKSRVARSMRISVLEDTIQEERSMSSKHSSPVSVPTTSDSVQAQPQFEIDEDQLRKKEAELVDLCKRAQGELLESRQRFPDNDASLHALRYWKAPTSAIDIARFVLSSQDAYKSRNPQVPSPAVDLSRRNSTVSTVSSVPSQDDSFSPWRASMISVGSQDQPIVNLTAISRKAKQAVLASLYNSSWGSSPLEDKTFSTQATQRSVLSPKKANATNVEVGQKKRKDKVLSSRGEVAVTNPIRVTRPKRAISLSRSKSILRMR